MRFALILKLHAGNATPATPAMIGSLKPIDFMVPQLRKPV
jgi:hypothetical protein